jgi:hypothetical protein
MGKKLWFEIERFYMKIAADGNTVDNVLENACAKLAEYRKGTGTFSRPTLDDLEWYSWPQTWGNTTLGFGGIGGQAITTAQTILVTDTLTGVVAIYHGGKFAYVIKNPSITFWERVRDWNLPGALHHRTGFEREEYHGA